ncbi:MAG: transposase [Planctomycetaceae bacterium]|nr:transposase [Planctomycetaceae bacterium]
MVASVLFGLAEIESEFRSRYAARAGIDCTNEQMIILFRLRQCCYIGEAKSHLQHLLTAVAINMVRLSDWWVRTPLSRTRCSRFAALQPAA